MADVFKMPKLGESVTTGTVTRWLMAVGDTVDFDDPLLEVSTDKVDSEIPSPFGGVLLEILVPEGETVAVGAELARIGAAGESGAAEPAGRGRAGASGGWTRPPAIRSQRGVRLRSRARQAERRLRQGRAEARRG